MMNGRKFVKKIKMDNKELLQQENSKVHQEVLDANLNVLWGRPVKNTAAATGLYRHP